MQPDQDDKVICIRCEHEITEDMESKEHLHGYLCEECMDDV